MINKLNFHKIILAIFSFSFLNGCAALTIDVDVYKGPLANHKDILVEQTVIMAEAAEPLLKRLFYQTSEKITEYETAKEGDKAISYRQLREQVCSIINLYGGDDDEHKTVEVTKCSYLKEGVSLNLKKKIATYKSKILNPQFQKENCEKKVCNTELKNSREILLTSLVHFAQHVLLIGNYQTFFEMQPDGIFDGIPWLNIDSRWNAFRNLENHTSILQTIGNTILFQVDEIKNQDTYLANEKKNGKREQDALRKAQDDTFPPAARIAPNSIEANLTAKEVMDKVIATLKYEHVTAVKKYGKNSDKDTENEVARLEEAIEAAYVHRSSLISIKSAMAYLRTSYPSTALQRNPNLNWKNMLDQDASRNIPIIGPLLSGIINIFEPEKNFEQYIAKSRSARHSNIDKQFWQNINQIRLTGGGDVNYVVIKDDIGNWTIKNYSTNVKDIVNSARSLGMYAMGVTPSSLPLDPKDNNPGSEIKEFESSTLDTQFDLFKEEYKNQTKLDLDNIKDIAKNLRNKINANRMINTEIKDDKNITESIDWAEGQHLEVANRPITAETNAEEEIRFVLREILHFYEAVDTAIYSKMIRPNMATRPNSTDTDSNLQSAQRKKSVTMSVLADVIKEEIHPFIESRLATVNGFKKAVEITNKTISSNETSAESN